jgi:N-acetyl-alpha-D-muramate 1-phosphate uridylyltransferase
VTLSLALLAGGKGTRLGPLTDQLPKSLVDVNGEPFIAHQLRLVGRQGITRVVICAGHFGEQIRAEIGDGTQFGLDVSYSWDGESLLGTAGALARALPLLPEAFFVMYGDSYLLCDYAAVETAFRQARKRALMTVYRNDNKFDRSNVEFEGNTLITYDKREQTQRMRHIDYGLAVLTRDALAEVPANVPSDLEGVYQALLARGELAGYEVSQRFFEIGSVAGLDELRAHLASAQRSDTEARRDHE